MVVLGYSATTAARASSRRAPLRDEMTMWAAPRAASARNSSRPMPCDAPVKSTRLPRISSAASLGNAGSGHTSQYKNSAASATNTGVRICHL